MRGNSKKRAKQIRLSSLDDALLMLEKTAPALGDDKKAEGALFVINSLRNLYELNEEREERAS